MPGFIGTWNGALIPAGEGPNAPPVGNTFTLKITAEDDHTFIGSFTIPGIISDPRIDRQMNPPTISFKIGPYEFSGQINTYGNLISGSLMQLVNSPGGPSADPIASWDATARNP